MEETKIWTVEGTSATQLETTNQMETEGLLEDILTANPNMLEEGLELVGRQTSTAGGPLDLLGVDTDGRLVVFELKRGKLNRDAVAQVIDYASHLDTLDSDSLNSHIESQSGKQGIEKIDDFGDWYSKLRASNELPEEDLDALKPPRMVLVGLGVDGTTERMVNYMANGGMPISLLTFYGFVNNDGKTLLARNLETDSERIMANQGPRSRPRNRQAQFEMRVMETLSQEMKNALDEIERMFRSQYGRFIRGFSTKRMNFSMDFSWSLDHAWDDGSSAKRRLMLFVEIDENKSGLIVGFNPIAIHFAQDEFKRLTDENIQFEKEPTQALWQEAGNEQDYKFSLHSPDDWEAQKDTLTALTKRICEAYDAAREKALSTQ